jgi:hypothetical protein
MTSDKIPQAEVVTIFTAKVYREMNSRGRICFWKLGKEEGHAVVMFIYIQRGAVYCEVARSLPPD